MTLKIVALAGGVGGAKLIQGLSSVSEPESLTCIVNTGDDDIFHGLHVCPDLDTVMYTLAGLSDTEKGWGLKDESYTVLSSLAALNQDTWFNLGDKDIATHLVRTNLLSTGQSLTEVTHEICRRFGVKNKVIPISNAKISTKLISNVGELSMQEYFVKHRWIPPISKIVYSHDKAQITDEAKQSLIDADLIIICPSNPLLSIGPMLSVDAAKDLIRNYSYKTICVSPLIGNGSVSGPAGKLMNELGMEASVVGLGKYYQNFCSWMIIDSSDRMFEPALVQMGFSVKMLPIIMNNDHEKISLASAVLEVGQHV
tara:strand:- start:10230 stop:11165 length:936 start_codon:yes stop_codon:yes gene_type:complete